MLLTVFEDYHLNTFMEKSEKQNLKREQKEVFESILCVPFSLFNVYFVLEMSSLKMK